jgi:hypothetical protein
MAARFLFLPRHLRTCARCRYYSYLVIQAQYTREFTDNIFELNAHCYPVWASLARDYLSIVAASVSSERAFSQGGIMISRHRNSLKGDIVEVLQCIKCAIRHDFLFQEPAPSSVLEAESQGEDVEEGEEIDENEPGTGY